MVDPVLSPGAYLLGVSWIVVVAGSAVVGAAALRRTFLPGWPPLACGVAVAVTALTTVLVVAEVLGGLGVLRWGMTGGAIVVVGGLQLALGRRWRGRVEAPTPPVFVRSPAALHALAAAAVAGLAAQWMTHVADALDRGMTHPDTLWYHGPYSAHFLETASLGDVGLLGQAQTRYYPLSSELLHSIAAMPFGRDVLSPFVNLGFAGLAIAAAALLGARRGVGALSVLGATLVLALPTLGGTQPGQGSSDVMAAALVLTAVALLLAGGIEIAPLAVAGAALGLAVGTKLSVLGLAGVLFIGVVVLCVRAERRRAGLAWTAGIVLTAGFWAVRNAVLVDNPLPFFAIQLGPVHLRGAAPAVGAPSIVGSLPRFDDWRGWYSGGLTVGFGRLWPVILLLGLAGAVAALWRGRSTLRAVALAVGAGLIAYPFTPYTGEWSFQYNLRILVPTLLVAVPLLSLVAPLHARLHRVLASTLVLLIGLNLTASHHERVAAWPGHLTEAVAATLTVLIVARALAVHRPGHAWRGAAPWSGVVLAVLATVAGFAVQSHYLDRRYVDAGLHDAVLNERFRTTSGQTIDVLGTPEVYPFFGADLSNRVTDHSASLNTTLARGRSTDDPCTTWRTRLSPGDRYVVISSFGFLLQRFPPDERSAIFEDDPATTTLYADDERAIYRIDGDLDPSTC